MKKTNLIKISLLYFITVAALSFLCMCCSSRHTGVGIEQNRVSGDRLKTGNRKAGLDNIAGNPVNKTENSRIFKGTYSVRIADFNGVLVLDTRQGRYYGTLRFLNWGRGLAEPLKNIKINGKKIYFERSILTREELDKFGGTRYFNQQYYGRFSEDGSVIKGYYIDSGSETPWKAMR